MSWFGQKRKYIAVGCHIFEKDSIGHIWLDLRDVGEGKRVWILLARMNNDPNEWETATYTDATAAQESLNSVICALKAY